MLAIYYGNCQVANLNHFLKLEKVGYRVKTIDCVKTEWDVNKLKRFIRRAKLIIMTYIRPNYRNIDYLSSQFIVKHAHPNTNIIIVPSIYFPLYHYDAMTIKLPEDGMLRDPNMHHYHNLLNCYLKGKSREEYLKEYVNNVDLYSLKELEKMADDGIKQIQLRQDEILKLKSYRNINVVLIDQFIKNNFQDKILFHTYHHPTNILYQHVIDQIIDFAHLKPDKINRTSDPLIVYGKMYIYDSMKKILKFDVDEYNKEVLKPYNNSLEYMVKRYYEAYKKKDNKKYIEYYRKNLMNKNQRK